ncbi:EspA/EspE family type VII secretion system effector [Mycolicibacterium hodleri]|uniref:EspA/EspE family type VII secretion system effector n=1 Tax=Mycolicibacterium hodleri TaxID=49897 RepID=UPI0021F2751B|nr:EspA/EspE family type VII secretion system effector [Mycolicibacterium hodleri]
MDGFRSTWSRANDTFGDGVPASGAEFDQSGALREMQAAVETAAPGCGWTGAASASYSEANARHAAVLGDIADLDRRFAAEVDRSAAVVIAGRRELGRLRTWVTDAAAATPRGQSGEWMRMIIAAKGIGRVGQTVQQAAAEMGVIGRRLTSLAEEYDELPGVRDR